MNKPNHEPGHGTAPSAYRIQVPSGFCAQQVDLGGGSFVVLCFPPEGPNTLQAESLRRLVQVIATLALTEPPTT